MYRRQVKPFALSTKPLDTSTKPLMWKTAPEIYLRHIRQSITYGMFLFISDATCAIENHGPAVPEIQAAALETHTLILRIISLAAPTLGLESLTLKAYSPQQSTFFIARLFRMSFSRLRNLKISGFYPFPTTAGKFGTTLSKRKL